MFDGANLEEKVGLGFLLISVDEDGSPRPCMLSVGEVLVTDSRTVRLGLWPGTRTVTNLARGGSTLFCFVTAGAVTYVGSHARPLQEPADATVSCFELSVDSVSTDLHAGMPVTAGITFAVEEPAFATVLSSWAGQLNDVRRAV